MSGRENPLRRGYFRVFLCLSTCQRFSACPYRKILSDTYNHLSLGGDASNLGRSGGTFLFLAFLERLTFGPSWFDLMRPGVALFLVSGISIIGMSANANQMFPAGGTSGTACPSGSEYKGSGFCKATKPDYQFFRAGGSSGTSCPSESQYKGNGFCRTR